jgi:copper resistance protein C
MIHRHLGLVVATSMLFVAGQAAAHAKLITSDPAANTTVAAPKTITLTFQKELLPAFSTFEVKMPQHDGMEVPVKIAISKDGRSIIGTPRRSLNNGAYKVIWSAATGDGHRMSGEVAFEVR